MPNQTKPLSGRDLWIKIHVFLGLTAGFLFALLGITGSLCIYREELEDLLNPQLVVENPQGKYLSLDNILAKVRMAHPSRHGEWVLELPQSSDKTVTAWYERPHETFGEYYAPLMVSVNPYTAEVVASRFWGHTFGTWIYGLHAQLQLGLFGARTVGILGFGLMVSCLSGLYLWWPGTVASIRSIFSIRHGEGLLRFAHDLHRLIGLCSAPALLLLAFTGIQLAFPKILETIAVAPDMGHGSDGPTIRSTAIPNNHPVSLSEATTIARGLFPHAEIRRIATPVGEDGTYRVNLHRPEEVNIRHPFTNVWIDRWSGQIREVRNPNKFTFGQDFISRLWPLHTGESFSSLGRPLWFFIGLTPALLFVSGLVQWMVKRNMLQNHAIVIPPLQFILSKMAKKFHRYTFLLSGYAYQASLWIIKETFKVAAWVKRWVMDKRK